jgi:hypothetical protein
MSGKSALDALRTYSPNAVSHTLFRDPVPLGTQETANVSALADSICVD